MKAFIKTSARTPTKVALAIFVLVIALYGRSLNYPFVSDDVQSIVANAAIQVPNYFWRVWSTIAHPYQPLTTTSHAFAWNIGGGHTWPFHLEKIFLFAGTCILLFLVWSRLWKVPGFYPNPAPKLGLTWKNRPHEITITPEIAAVILAFLFAVHPANSQAVLYIAATSTLLCGFWYLFAYYLYLRFRESGGSVLLAGTVTVFGMCALADGIGLTFPAIVLLTEAFLPRSTMNSKGFGILILGALGLAFAFHWSDVLTQFRLYSHYLWLAIWPSGLNADSAELATPASLGEPQILLAIAGNLGLLTIAFVRRKQIPVLLFSLLWFYIALVPDRANDHRALLAYFGLFGALVPGCLWVFDRIFPSPKKFASPRLSAWLAIGIFLGFTIANGFRISDWSTPVTFWTDMSKKNPNSASAQENLAIAYIGTKDYVRAKEVLDQCERTHPEDAACKVQQGVVLSFLGQETEAEKKFEHALLLDPKSLAARYFYARFHYNRGRYSLARPLFREIVESSHGESLDAALDEIQSEYRLGHDRQVEILLAALDARFPDHPRVRELH